MTLSSVDRLISRG